MGRKSVEFDDFDLCVIDSKVCLLRTKSNQRKLLSEVMFALKNNDFLFFACGNIVLPNILYYYGIFGFFLLLHERCIYSSLISVWCCRTFYFINVLNRNDQTLAVCQFHAKTSKSGSCHYVASSVSEVAPDERPIYVIQSIFLVC